jgi:endonuclease/exonuclease/phosphatase (EEP) superfamily protein YafD
VWARFTARATGAGLTVVDVHAIPHVDDHGRPRHLPRQALYRRWLIRLGELVDSRAGPVLVLGDFNVDTGADCRHRYYWFPCAWSGRHHLTNVWRPWGEGRGTHGRRTIDYVMDRGRHLTPLSRYVLTGYASDHRPVVTRYRLSQ